MAAMKVIDLKNPSERTESVLHDLRDLYRKLYSGNILVRGSERSEEVADVYAEMLVEEIKSGRVPAVLAVVVDGKVKAVSQGVRFRLKGLKLPESRLFDRFAGYMKELDEIAFGAMERTRHTNPLYDEFLTAYYNGEFIVEWGRTVSSFPRAMLALSKDFKRMSRTLQTRFEVGHVSDGAIIMLQKSSIPYAEVARLELRKSKAYASSEAAEFLATPNPATGVPPFYAFMLRRTQWDPSRL